MAFQKQQRAPRAERADSEAPARTPRPDRAARAAARVLQFTPTPKTFNTKGYPPTPAQIKAAIAWNEQSVNKNENTLEDVQRYQDNARKLRALAS